MMSLHKKNIVLGSLALSITGLVIAVTFHKPSFEHLSATDQKYIIEQHDKAYLYFQNKNYETALTEIQKIFPLVADYKDSREIEHYSKLALEQKPDPKLTSSEHTRSTEPVRAPTYELPQSKPASIMDRLLALFN
jgi:hypothetical protein